MNRESIIINAMTPIYDVVGYSEELESPLYKLKSITVEFLLTHNSNFGGRYDIPTKKTLTQEEMKDKIMEVLQ